MTGIQPGGGKRQTTFEMQYASFPPAVLDFPGRGDGHSDAAGGASKKLYASGHSFRRGHPLAAAAAARARGDNSRRGMFYLGVGLELAALASLAARKEHQPTEACRIVGVVGGVDATSTLLEGLAVLQNRGYHSAGIATMSPDNASIVTKYGLYARLDRFSA